MIAQTFFLLSVSDKLNDHLTIHFGRPSMKKYLENLQPDEVYFCGGQSFKESVRTICFEKRIPFHSESFDSADSSLVNQVAASLKRSREQSAARSKQSFASSGGGGGGGRGHEDGKRYDSVSTGYSYSKKHSSIFH
jgi:ferredoxin-NADP reductase